MKVKVCRISAGLELEHKKNKTIKYTIYFVNLTDKFMLSIKITSLPSD